MTLLVYWYADNQWQEVHHASSTMSCQAKMRKADKSGNKFDIYRPHWRVDDIETDARNMHSKHFDEIEKEGIVLAHSKGKLTFASDRERWYYFALANCDPSCVGKNPNHCNGEIVTTFLMEFTNGNGWDKKITADVQGLAESSIVLFSFWVIVACCIMPYQLTIMHKRNMLHQTVKILAQAIFWHICELFFAVIYYCNYIDTGEPSTAVRLLYRFCSATSETLIVLFLILLAKGWTVVRRKISAQGRVKITAFATVYICVQFAVVTWEGK